MDTKLTLDQIHLALRNSGLWNKRSDIMVPNLSWGLLSYEADFVILSVNEIDAEQAVVLNEIIEKKKQKS